MNSQDNVIDIKYLRGFDDGYNAALLDLEKRYKSHVEKMIKNILDESNNR